MASKKGLSFEEKRTRMLSFFHEKQDFFLLKEVEKLCHKEKGITSMSAKDVLQSLVDDNLVDSEKIGTCVYFWSFPSKLGEKRKRRQQELQALTEAATAKKEKLLASVEAGSAGKEDSESRDKLAAELASLQSRLAAANQQLLELQECDPEVLDALLSDAKLAQQAANRWTDNVFSLTAWMQQKFPSIDQATISNQFGLPNDFDYVEQG